MAERKYIVAIDLGTSGPKVALVATDGEIIASAVESTELILLPGGGVEQDPEDWWQAIVRGTRRVLDRDLIDRDDIVAVACGAQWLGTVPVGRNGDHLANAIIWMDSRGSKYAREITSGLVKVEGYSVTKLRTWIKKTAGIPSRSGKDSLSHILWLKHERPEVYRATHQFLEPKDWLNFRLTGQYAAGVDSIAGHWVTDNRDINNIHYDDELLKLATIDGDKLPPLKQPIDVLGPLTERAASDLGLGRRVQVVMGTPDVQAAAVGSGAVDDYAAHLYVGTSSWLTCHIPFKRTDIFHSVASLPSAIPGRYFAANDQETAGGCLNWLRDNILFPDDALHTRVGEVDVFRAFDELAEQAPVGSGGAVFTPWLNGERTPVDSHTLRGGFHNLSLATTRGHLVRAVFEGVAYNTRWLMESVERFVKRKLDPIRYIGGGASSEVWCQIMADVLGRTIHQVEAPRDANALGAAFLASVGLGYLKFSDLNEKVRVAKAYEPDARHGATYDAIYKEFRNIYKAEKGIHARLNKE